MNKPIPDQLIVYLEAKAAAIFSAADQQQWDEMDSLRTEFDGVVKKVPFNPAHKELITSLLAKIDSATNLAIERRNEIGRLVNALGKGPA